MPAVDEIEDIIACARPFVLTPHVPRELRGVLVECPWEIARLRQLRAPVTADHLRFVVGPRSRAHLAPPQRATEESRGRIRR